ncbi:hypothetical protein [Lacticaseibacillus daqingensis]|uniref:hypothetical protein n=1 Tax=Lacticaseibacillus daqingensis TaxID=2486014 RepID=UPI000F78EFA2|nr:hypothetical protein [Lacticaseibacillus daqingensis]
MLDERLIGTVFTLPPTGDEVVLYGIHYHFSVLDTAQPGDAVVIVGASALGLRVRRLDRELQY